MNKLLTLLIGMLFFISFASALTVTDTTGLSYGNLGADGGSHWINFSVNQNIKLIEAGRIVGDGHTALLLKNASGLLATGSLSGNVWTFDYNLSTGIEYQLYITGSATGRYGYNSFTPIINNTYISYNSVGYTGGEYTTVQNITFNVSSPSFPLIVSSNLSTPGNNTAISDTGSNFTANYTVTNGNLTNATYYVWNSSGSLVNKTTISGLNGTTNTTTLFIDDFTMQPYTWNVEVCAYNSSTSLCNFANNNFTLNVGASLVNVNYTNPVYETSRQSFTANMTLLPGSNLYDTKFVYNGTEYASNFTLLSANNYFINATIDIPSVSASSTDFFYWKLIYSIGTNSFLYENSTTYNQTVNPISIFQCAGSTNLTANYTFYDEENNTRLNVGNLLATYQIWLGDGVNYKNVSFNNLDVNETVLCLNPYNVNYKVNGIIQYEKAGNIKRNYYYENATFGNETQNTHLYILRTAASTTFLVTVKQANQQEVNDALLYSERYYPGTGLWEIVAMGKTDDTGTAPLQFEAETEDYKIVVIKNNAVLYTSPMQKMYCLTSPCALNLQTGASSTATWIPIGNLSNMIYSLDYSNTTKLWSYQYIDTSGTTHYGRLLVYTINAANGKNVICDVNSTSNAQILTCNVTGYSGKVYAEGYISRSPEILVWAKEVILNAAKATFGMEGLLWAGLILLVLAIIGVSVGGVPVGVVFTVVGFMLIGFLGLISIGSVLLWGVIILGMIILWIIKQ